MDTEKLGSGLINVVLGALILWVAQTTFQHSGQLAGTDQKYESLQTQHDSVRDRLDSLMHALNDRTRSRFTREDGERLASRIDESSDAVALLERRIGGTVTDLRLQVIALQTGGAGQRELGRLRTDVECLHASLYPTTANGPTSVGRRSEVAARTEASLSR